MTDYSGKITSPGYPSHYPNDVQCTWTISVPDGFIVKLTFKFFYMENGGIISTFFNEYMDNISK